LARILEGDLHHFNFWTTHPLKFMDVLSRIQAPQLGEGWIDSIWRKPKLVLALEQGYEYSQRKKELASG